MRLKNHQTASLLSLSVLGPAVTVCKMLEKPPHLPPPILSTGLLNTYTKVLDFQITLGPKDYSAAENRQKSERKANYNRTAIPL